jgi:hypothetical protein
MCDSVACRRYTENSPSQKVPAPSPSVSPARQIAFNVLRRVLEGGYASDILLKQSAALDSRDAGLASEIVFGSLRYQAQIDHLIGRLAAGPLDPEVRIALRMGIYQLRHLDRDRADRELSIEEWRRFRHDQVRFESPLLQKARN